MTKIDVKQEEHSNKYYHEILQRGDFDGFINPDSYWYWEHTYCLEHLKEFFTLTSGSTYLTVGDGFCGREGGFIQKFGNHVHASDIEPCLIEISRSKGLVDSYSRQDLYNLTFSDNSCDYVFIKESLHHLSKPYAGFYEMLRVAKKGVILIEPNGDTEQPYIYNNFESSGNYMFTFSSHDLIKSAIAFGNGYKYFLLTYSIVFYSYHNDEELKLGHFDQERKRLLEYDKGFDNPAQKPLLILICLRDKEVYDQIIGTDYKKVMIE